MTLICKIMHPYRRLTTFLHPDKIFPSNIGRILRRNVSSKPPPNVFKLSMVGATVGAVVGTGYSLHQLNKPTTHVLNEQTVIPTIHDVPKITPSKSIRIAGDQSGLKLTLYQYQTCPFCCKVRAFLDYNGISYDVVEVDPVLRQATKWSTYKKVPILLAKVPNGYQPLNDSTMIISSLASYLNDEQSLTDVVKCYPFLNYKDESGSIKSEIMNRYFLMFNEQRLPEGRTKEDINEERKWRMWVDDVLVHDLSPNVYRTTEEALQAFNWFSEVGDWEKHFPAWERLLIIYVGAVAMFLIGKRLKSRHNLKDNVRESLYDHCDEWASAVKKKGTDFMGGDRPNLADLAMYGVLCSIEGCDTFKDLLKHSDIKRWYLGVREAVRNHRGSEFA